jgi:hypothetical protein
VLKSLYGDLTKVAAPRRLRSAPSWQRRPAWAQLCRVDRDDANGYATPGTCVSEYRYVC